MGPRGVLAAALFAAAGGCGSASSGGATPPGGGATPPGGGATPPGSAPACSQVASEAGRRLEGARECAAWSFMLAPSAELEPATVAAGHPVVDGAFSDLAVSRERSTFAGLDLPIDPVARRTVIADHVAHTESNWSVLHPDERFAHRVLVVADRRVSVARVREELASFAPDTRFELVATLPRHPCADLWGPTPASLEAPLASLPAEPSGRAGRLAELIASAAAGCAPLAEAFSASSAVAPGDRAAFLARAVPATLRECHCAARDVDALLHLVARLLGGGGPAWVAAPFTLDALERASPDAAVGAFATTLFVTPAHP